MRKHWRKLLAVIVVALALLPLLSAVAWLLEQKATAALLEGYDRIHDGQTRGMVESFLGRPSETRAPSGMWPYSGAPRDVIAGWRSGDVTVIVKFSGGKLVASKYCTFDSRHRGPLEYLKDLWRRCFS